MKLPGHPPRLAALGLLLAVLCLNVRAARAQDTPPQGLIEGEIAYGQLVEETIDSTYIYDVWQFSGQAGDQIRAIMVGSGGLMPLVGVRDASGTVVERSGEGTANGTVEFTYTLPTSGRYALVPSRAALSDGTSTGGYRLALQWLNAPTPTPVNGAVTFRCGTDEAAALASLGWSPAEVELNAAYQPAYVVRVYGLDGLRPVVRVGGEAAGCYGADDAAALSLVGDALTLPGGETIEAEAGAFALTLDSAAVNGEGQIALTIGAAGGTRGRYVAVVGSFAIEPPDEGDNFRLLNAPLAAAAPLDLYMVSIGANNRLDPAVALISDAGDVLVCDDAGRRPCADLPGAADLRIVPAVGEAGDDARVVTIAGSRFSAGLRLAAGELGWRALSARSFSGNTRGAYALVLVGALDE